MALYELSSAQVRQILYCMESMETDYIDDTDDYTDWHEALEAVQKPLSYSNPKSNETRRGDIIVGILAVAMASMTAAAFLGFDITAKKPAVTPIEVIPYQHHH